MESGRQPVDSGIVLTCAKCGRGHPLSEEEIVFFHPRFFCLTCGEKVHFDVDPARLKDLLWKRDRERRLPDSRPVESQETMRHVRRDGTPQGMDGG